MSSRLARRAAGFGTTIFTEMSALALEYGAINLGQGFPDFPGPAFVKEAAAAAIAGDVNQYAPMPGLPHLRQAVAAQWERDHGRAVDWQREVTITSGATEALCDVMLALLDPGDLALIFEPAYDAYVPDIILAGGAPLPVRLYPPDAAHPSGWWFDEAELRAAFARRPKLVVVNTPHNPTGKVYSRAELQLIAELCQEYDVLAVTDEVYDRLLYNGATHLPLATLPGMWDRTLTLNSAGKTFSVTGWKIGYAVGPAPLNHALRQTHQWVTFATASPLQEAVAVALEQAPLNGYYQNLLREYDERRVLLRQVLESAGLPTLPVEGSYFISADIGALGYTDDRAFCRRLTTEFGVAAIPTSVFYSDPSGAPNLARFCFAKRRETIQAAAAPLAALRARV